MDDKISTDHNIGTNMQRKLVKQGQNALTVTVPSEWIKANNLKAGNFIDLTISNDRVILQTATKHAGSTIEIDVTDQDIKLFWQKVLAAYIDGCDEIIIKHNNMSMISHHAKHLFGMALIENTKNRSKLKNIIQTPDESFDALYKRCLLQFAALGESIADTSNTYEEIKEQEHTLDINLYFCMRYLRKYHNLAHDYKLFLACATIESAADNMSELRQNNPTKENLTTIMQASKMYAKELDFDKAFAEIAKLREHARKKSKTFADGLVFAVLETMYNYIGYIRK